MTTNKKQAKSAPQPVAAVIDGEGAAPQTQYLDRSKGQTGPEDFPNPEWEAWGGPPDLSPDGLVENGVAKGAYKQPAKQYITPAAHFVERFGTMHAASSPYHPYTIAVGMNAVREYFQGQGYTDAEAGMMAVAAFDIHVKSGFFLDPNKGRAAVELSKEGRDINVEQRRFNESQIQRLQHMQSQGAVQEAPPDIDFEALEQAIASPGLVAAIQAPHPLVDEAVIDRSNEA